MLKRIAAILAIMSTAIFSAGSSCSGGGSGADCGKTPDGAAEIRAERFPDSFSISGTRLFGKLFKKGENTIISPYSIGIAMDMAYCGARGETAEEMARVLGLPEGATPGAVMKGAKEVMEAIKSSDDVTIETANSIWTRSGVKKKYASDCKRNFNAEVRNEVDADKINGWVSKSTHEKIKTIIDSADGIDTALINAVYFNGVWAVPFKSDMTRKKDFTKSDGTKIKVDMMHGTMNVPYYEDENCKAVRLDYKGGYSMFVMVPKEGREAKAVPDSIEGIENLMTNYDVRVSIPKFKAEYKTELKPTFESLGMKKAFSPGADFGAISEGLRITSIIHKTFIDVSEKGTEAAAATAVIMTKSMPPMGEQPKTFTADRPFLFIIADDTYGIPIFAGAVENPEYK